MRRAMIASNTPIVPGCLLMGLGFFRLHNTL